MAVRPMMRPKQRVIAPPVMPGLSPESLAALPRVLSRVTECPSGTDQPVAQTALRQPAVIAKPQVVAPALIKTEAIAAKEVVAENTAVTKPTLPAFLQSRKIMVAAGILAIVSAVAVGYQFRPKQQIIVVHPATKPQNSLVASPTNSINPANMKPAFQPLSTSTLPTMIPAKETTSTASVMPGATWPPEKTPDAAPLPSQSPPFQTATKPLDSRTSSNRASSYPVAQETLPPMPPQFPQAANIGSNPVVVYNQTMNASPSPLASGFAPQNNLPPQFGMQPAYTAARPEMQPRQPLQPSPDGSFGAYGGAQLNGQIQPLLRR